MSGTVVREIVLERPSSRGTAEYVIQVHDTNVVIALHGTTHPKRLGYKSIRIPCSSAAAAHSEAVALQTRKLGEGKGYRRVSDTASPAPSPDTAMPPSPIAPSWVLSAVLPAGRARTFAALLEAMGLSTDAVDAERFLVRVRGGRKTVTVECDPSLTVPTEEVGRLMAVAFALETNPADQDGHEVDRRAWLSAVRSQLSDPVMSWLEAAGAIPVRIDMGRIAARCDYANLL